MANETVQTTYLSQGIDKSGNKTKGEIQCSEQAPVKPQMRKQGVAPNKFKIKSKDLFGPQETKDQAWRYSRVHASVNNEYGIGHTVCSVV